MTWNMFRRGALVAAITGAMSARAGLAPAELFIYEPFNYTPGQNLGGVDNDPDPMGPAGVAEGQIGNYVGGGQYRWYARDTVNNYQSNKDTLIVEGGVDGGLKYEGLATSQGEFVSYGSALPNTADSMHVNNVFNSSLYGDSVALPSPVSSGSLYASFIIRIKSELNDGVNGTTRHSPVGFVSDVSPPGTLGTAMGAQTGTVRMGGFWMRRDPVDVSFTTTNFGVGKSSQDGIGPGQNTVGHNAGWQNSDTSHQDITEDNQFGDVNGQQEPDFNNSATWQTYFVVLKYEFDFAASTVNEYDAPGSTPSASSAAQVDTVSLWMNPGKDTLGVANGEVLASAAASGNVGSYYAATDAYTGANNDLAEIRSFALLGHRLTTNNTMAVDFDELRIGTTWADVTPKAVDAGLPGDFNQDGNVDAADYVMWRKNTSIGDYADFVENFGESNNGSGGSSTVPEPSALAIVVMFVASAFFRRCR